MQITKITKTALALTACALLSASAAAEVNYRDILSAEEFPVGNMLTWATDLEVKSELFVVERSNDGVNFFNIGKLDAAGSSEEENEYRFLDVGVQEQLTFYRLKQVDTDGTSGYSHVVKISKNILNNFMVVRMNTTDVQKAFELTIDNLEDNTLNYQVRDLADNVISEEEAALTAGLNNIIIDTEDLESGIYKVQLRVKDETEVLVIQKVGTKAKTMLRASKDKSKTGG